jgi:hypothetical protein
MVMKHNYRKECVTRLLMTQGFRRRCSCVSGGRPGVETPSTSNGLDARTQNYHMLQAEPRSEVYVSCIGINSFKFKS